MKKTFKKILCTLLAVVICLTVAPLQGFVGIDFNAKAVDYEVGDIIQFGSYPQTEVKDESIISRLNSLAPEWDEWTSYGYYSSTSSLGQMGTMRSGNWMRYIDLEHEGEKYRGVKFTQYRPYYTIYQSSSSNSYQDDNGYNTNTTYWFKFEPLKWKVLDPDTNLIICESIIDCQPYSNTLYYKSGSSTTYAYYNDASYSNYASNYETSSIRNWLNNNFYNTAFTDSEKNNIKISSIENKGYYTSIGTTGYAALDSNSTEDYVFMLSYNDSKNASYGFNNDDARRAKGSDYAKSQGLYVKTGTGTYGGESYWHLRAAGDSSLKSTYIAVGGHSAFVSASSCEIGVRPALNFNRTSEIFQSQNLKSEWFEKGAYSGYNHELAQFCADLVMLGYKYNEATVTEGLKDVGLSVKSINMAAKRDEVNYFIADKSIDINGEDKNLIVIGCIGSYKNQWYSNFDPLGYARENPYADNSEKHINHIGFADARDYVYGKLNEYIKTKNIDKNNSIILLTGHSRGSATVNLLGAKLIDNSSSFGVSRENIYTYGFATPNTTTNSNSSKYDSIINIVNPEDFVTKVMLKSWGYRRNGKTYTLPSKTNDKNYQYYLNKMRPIFKETTGELYDPYKKGEVKTYKMVKNFGEEVSTLDNFYSETFWYSMSFDDLFVYKTPFTFFRNTLLKYLVSDDMSEIFNIILLCGPFYLGIITYFAWPDINSGEVIDAITSDKKVLDGIALGGKFEHAHLMDTYAAYIHSMTSEEVTDVVREGHKGTVNCPVDIEIYDKETGELVGRIVNNLVDEEIESQENSIVMDVEGDSKSFWLPSNGDYEIKLIGNDEGTMDYTMSEIDSDIGEVKRANFFDVKITDGLTMTADIISDEFSVEQHTLTFENGEELEPAEVFVDENITECSIEITTTKGGFANSSKKVKIGDYVSLTATANEGWKFMGWYENGELISTELEIDFVAKSDRNFEVKFEHNHSYETETVDATCTEDGTITYTCSCSDTYTKKIEANGHTDSEWIVDKDSTCSAEGSKHIECTVCEEVLKTEAIAKLPHSYLETVTEPTCTAKGYTTYTCACGDTYIDDYTDKLDHKYTSEITTPATHLTEGVKTFSCECGESYTEPVAKLEGHTYTSEVTKEATHLEEGVTTYTCECGDSYTETIVKLEGHTYESVVTEPTCTAKGYTTYTCACGDTYIDDYTDKLDHKYTSEITIESTHLKEGVKTFTCKCGDTYTESVDKLEGHTYTSKITKEATHLAEGETTYTCECGRYYTESIEKTKEHSYAVTSVVVPTCEKEGYAVYICPCGDTYTGNKTPATGHNYEGNICSNCGRSRADNCKHLCHKSGFMGFIWKIVQFFWKLFKMNPVCECGVNHY